MHTNRHKGKQLVGGKEDVGFGPAVYASIDEPYPGITPRWAHVSPPSSPPTDAGDEPLAMLSECDGHKGGANSVAFLADPEGWYGGSVVSGGADGTVRLWNAKAAGGGRRLGSALQNRKAFVYQGHTDEVTSVACSPDGKLLASGSKDRTVRFWHPGVNGQSGAGGSVIRGHGGSVRCVDFSDDGSALLSASDDKTVKIWSLPAMRFSHALSGHTHWVRSAAFDPGHSMVVVSGGDDKTVRIWHMPRKAPVQTLHGHTASVRSVAFNPDGFSIASASADATVKLWDVRTGRLLQHYEPHAAPINSLKFHPSGNALLSVADDATLSVMDLKEGRVVAQHTTLRNTPTLGVAFSDDGEKLATASADGTVRLYRSGIGGDGEQRAPSPPKPSRVRRPATAPSPGRSSSAASVLNKGDITELKSLGAPPLSVKLVGDAVCILLGKAPSFKTFKSLLADSKFLQTLRDYDKASPDTVRKLHDAGLMSMPEFQPDAIGKVSKAAKSLCMWVHEVVGGVPPSPKPKSRAVKKREPLRVSRPSAAKDIGLGLTAAELIELASLKNPPPVAVAVANAVCILLGAAPSVSTTPSKAPPSGAVSYWNAFKEMIRPRPFDRTAPAKFVKKLQTTPIAPDAVAAVTAYVEELVRVPCSCHLPCGPRNAGAKR